MSPPRGSSRKAAAIQLLSAVRCTKALKRCPKGPALLPAPGWIGVRGRRPILKVAHRDLAHRDLALAWPTRLAALGLLATWTSSNPAFALETITTTTAEGQTLAQLVDEAFGQGFSVRVSEAEVEQARALHKLAEAQFYPRLQGQVVFGGPTGEAKTRVRNDVSTVTDASFGGDLDFGELGVTFRGEFLVGMPVYTFGKLKAGKEAASKLIDAAELNVQVTRSALLVDLTRAFWSIQLLDTLTESLDDGELRLASVLEKIEELLDADSGQVTENDRLRLEFALGELQVRKAQAEGALPQLEQAIRLLIGRTQTAPLMLAKADLKSAAPTQAPPLEALIQAAKLQRPEVLALGKVVDATEALKRLREAQVWPDVVVGGFINFAYTSNATDQTNPFIEDPYNLVDAGLGLGMQFNLELFTILAQIEQAEADLQVRRAQQAFALEAAELDVRRVHAQLEAIIAQSKRLRRAHTSARGWLTASTLAYDIGAGRADELIDAFLAWASSEAQLQVMRYEAVALLAELGRATGDLRSSLVGFEKAKPRPSGRR